MVGVRGGRSSSSILALIVTPFCSESHSTVAL